MNQMEDALEVHGKYERALDLDGSMSTVAAHPTYEFVNLGWRVDGRDAVREAYRRLFCGYIDKITSSTARTLTEAPAALCRESFTVVTGKRAPVTCRTITVITFEGDLVSGERFYTDSYATDLIREAFGADFGDVPGVSTLS
jgi:hypothetical protein